MVKIKDGDILEAEEDILIHQVNIDGIMGDGVARQLADQYSGLENYYSEFCKRKNNDYKNLRGEVCFYLTEDNKVIANIFSQDKDFNTDYEAMKMCLEKTRENADKNNLTVAIPFKIGCGIANGEWEIVMGIINQAFKNENITIYKLR